MIPKHSRGWNVGGLIRYLMGPGRANEHVEQRVIAAWDDYSVTHQPPRREGVGSRQCGFDVRELVERLRTPAELGGVSMARPAPDAAGKVPQGPVWQCSLRNHADDRILSDAEWAEVVADVLHRTGIAPRGDAGGCRWVAVRHADDHVHIAAVLVRQDTFKKFSPRGDWPATRRATTAAEVRLGLIRTEVPDGTAAGAPSRAEMEKAERRELGETPRVSLRRAVRVAAVLAQDVDGFFAALEGEGRVVVSRRVSDAGELVGYSVAAAGDVNADGKPVWFSGSTLASDLSLPALRARWASATRAEQIPPAADERGEVGKREYQVAVEQALAAIDDATSLLAAGGYEEAAGIAHAAEDMLTAVTVVGREDPFSDEVLPKDGPADVYQRAARTAGVGQPREWGPVAVALRCAAWRLAAVGPLMVRRNGKASTAELMVAIAELIGEIALYHQARQCLAQARAAQATREVVMARRPPGHPQQSRGPDGRRPGPTRTAGVSKEARTPRRPPTAVMRPVIGQPGGNTPGRDRGR